MAKAPTEEQSQLKRRARRRLVGSIALVTVVAVVLPWVLESEPRDADQQIAIQIPAPDSSKFTPKPPPDASKPPESSPGATQASAPDMTGSQSTPPVPEPSADALRAEQDKVLAPPVKHPVTSKPPLAKDSKDKTPEKHIAEAGKKSVEKHESAAERAKAAAKSTTDSKAYVVQVAALVDADKAVEIQKSLAAKGLKAYTEKVKTANGEVTRVRVGPFPGRDAAEKERGRMKSLGFDGNVAPK